MLASPGHPARHVCTQVEATVVQRHFPGWAAQAVAAQAGGGWKSGVTFSIAGFLWFPTPLPRQEASRTTGSSQAGQGQSHSLEVVVDRQHGQQAADGPGLLKADEGVVS